MAVLEALREQVLAANCALPDHGLVKLTSGDASGIDFDVGHRVGAGAAGDPAARYHAR